MPSLGPGSFTCEVRDEAGALLGWLAVDTVVNGRCHGGVRLAPDVSPDELRRLARRMTLKFGFVGLPGGGAKAGVIDDPEGPPEERLARLRQFAAALAPLLRSGCYQPAADLGTHDAEIDAMLAWVDVRRGPREPTRTQSGFYTSLTVVAGAEVAARCLGYELSGLRAAIQGFGKVGTAVAQGLAQREVRIVAVSTHHGALYHPGGLPIEELAALSRRVGSRFVTLYQEAERIDREELLSLPVDLLCPCATSESIHIGNVTRIQARIISAGANLPVTLEAERLLLRQGTLCLPDFVTNCGGVLGGTMAYAGLGTAEIRRMIEMWLVPRMVALIESTWGRGEVPSPVAERIALERFRRAKQQAEQRSWKNRGFQVGLALYRRGWIPPRSLGPLARRYFAARLR